MVLVSVVAIIIYRVLMDIDYCPNASASECLIVTTIISSVLNAISILLLQQIYNRLAKWLTEWGKRLNTFHRASNKQTYPGLLYELSYVSLMHSGQISIHKKVGIIDFFLFFLII